MKLQNILQPQALDELHHLPMTRVEELLKRCKEQKLEYHDLALTPQQMADYIQWMATEFGGQAEFSFSPKN